MKTLSKGGEAPITATPLPRWMYMATEKPCRRNCKERGSPVSAPILRPSSDREKKEMASGPNTLLRSRWPPGRSGDWS